MESEPASRVRELLDRARAMDNIPAQVMIAEDAVRLADLHGDLDLGFQARQVLISSAVFSGLDERAVAPFSWCLSQFDRDPKRFDGHRQVRGMPLLWQYKWIVGAAEDWPQVPLDRLHGMLDDMERRHRQHGFSDRSTLKHRLSTAILRGDAAEAREVFRRWKSSARDELSDCPACERNAELVYWGFLGEDEQAWERSMPIIEGTLRCSTVPRVSYAHLLLPLVRLGRLPEAVQCHLKGHRLSVRNPKWTREAAQHILFLSLTGHHPKAVRLLESHIPYPHDPIAADRADHFEFFLAARFLLERLRSAGRKTIKLRLPEAFPPHRPEGKYEIAGLEAWFESAASRVAVRFDARNRTDAFTRRIATNLALGDLVSPFPLRAPRASNQDENGDD